MTIIETVFVRNVGDFLVLALRVRARAPFFSHDAVVNFRMRDGERVRVVLLPLNPSRMRYGDLGYCLKLLIRCLADKSRNTLHPRGKIIVPKFKFLLSYLTHADGAVGLGYVKLGRWVEA